jgi:predicted TPR repeat methyltransferase
VLVEVLARYPDTRKVAVAAQDGLMRTAASTGDASAWFGVGFYREVLGDRAGAVDAYRTALGRGLGGASAVYAQAALQGSAHPFP